MKVFAAILKAFVRGSWLLSLFALVLVSLPIVALLTGWLFPESPAANIGLAMAPLGSFFVGMLMGLVFARLTDFGGVLSLPGYGPRLLRVTSLLGVLAWLPIPLSLALGHIDLTFFAWLRWAPLWALGAMGMGFLMVAGSSVVAASKGYGHWSQFVWGFVPLAAIVLFTNTTAGALLNMPIFASLPGLTPMAVICLLLGPLSWPALLARKVKRTQNARAQGVPRPLDAMLRRRRGGNAFDTWYLSKLLTLWHSRERPRPEFLVFPPYLWSSWLTGAVFIPVLAVFPSFVEILMGMPWRAPDYSHNGMGLAGVIPAMALMPIMLFSTDGARVGRILLLPGLKSRKTLPRWLLSSLLSRWMRGAVAALLPAAGLALWFGMEPVKLGLYAMLVLLLASYIAALTFWRIPRMKRSTQVDSIGLVFWVPSYAAIPLAEALLFDRFSAPVCVAAMCLLFAVPLTLYALALKRWQTMEYGA